MRTTLSLDKDVAAAVQQLRRDRDIGLSEAVNELIRTGLSVPAQRKTFRQDAVDIGLRVGVSDVANALDELDRPATR